MIKKYKVLLTRHAQNDLEHVYYYIAADSVANASKFILQLEKEIYFLDHLPNCNPLISENEYFGTDYRHLIYNKYRIIYRIIDDSVIVLRVIHSSKLLEG